MAAFYVLGFGLAQKFCDFLKWREVFVGNLL